MVLRRERQEEERHEAPKCAEYSLRKVEEKVCRASYIVEGGEDDDNKVLTELIDRRRQC